MSQGNKKRPRPHPRTPPAILSLQSPLPSSVSFYNTYVKRHRPCLLKQAGPSLVPKAMTLLGIKDGEAEGVVERLTAILGPERGKNYNWGCTPPFQPLLVSSLPPLWTNLLPSSSDTDTSHSEPIVYLSSLAFLQSSTSRALPKERLSQAPPTRRRAFPSPFPPSSASSSSPPVRQRKYQKKAMKQRKTRVGGSMDWIFTWPRPRFMSEKRLKRGRR